MKLFNVQKGFRTRVTGASNDQIKQFSMWNCYNYSDKSKSIKLVIKLIIKLIFSQNDSWMNNDSFQK